METIGIVGLGRMGRPMGARLARAGYRVVGHDVSGEAREPAAAVGIEVVDSARAVGEQSAASLVIVGFDDEVTSACLDADAGILAGASAGHTLMVCSTVRPETVLALREPAAARGVEVLDATLCRAEHAAVDGTLLVMVGGSESAYERWRPMMAAFATDTFHLGDLGAGQVGKMINNQLLWAAVVANWEGLRLGRRLGVAQEPLRQALLKSSGNNWALETWRASRPMPWAEKDMAIVLDYAARVGLEMPVSATAADAIAAVKLEKARWTEGGGAKSAMSDFLDAFEDEFARTSRAAG
jgi:3-hydroxyisobutyrate dehydrogenase-like beta-hydroxyacid dehydrogenase